MTLRDSVARTRRQIDLMNEYRTRLIADVVTGQLGVREAAEVVLKDQSNFPGTRNFLA